MTWGMEKLLRAIGAISFAIITLGEMLIFLAGMPVPWWGPILTAGCLSFVIFGIGLILNWDDLI